jgi:hypothetical protein
MRPSLAGNFLALRSQRAQGRPGARCTRGLACEKHKAKRTRAYRFSGSSPAFPAQWFYGLLRALPGDRAFLSPSPAGNSRRLDASVEASGPHDFAVRVGAVRHGHFHVHRIPHPTSVTTAKRPSCGRETADIWTDLPIRKIRIFSRKGLDRGGGTLPGDLPVGSFLRTCGATESPMDRVHGPTMPPRVF